MPKSSALLHTAAQSPSRASFISHRAVPWKVQDGRNNRGRCVHARATVAYTNPADQYFDTDKRPIILFDGVCNLCNGGVDTALKFDKKGALRFAALQSGAGKRLLQRSGRAPNDISSIVLVEPSGSFIKSEAVLRIAKYLEIPFPVLAQLGFPFPLFFRDAVYDAVAGSRYDIFGRTTVCRMKDADQMDRFLE